MIKSKKLEKFINIKHGFFDSRGGVSSGIYKSLNCGVGSSDKIKSVKKNLKIVSKKIGTKKRIILLVSITQLLGCLEMHEVNVDSIRVSLVNYQRVVILKDKASGKSIPIRIGS